MNVFGMVMFVMKDYVKMHQLHIQQMNNVKVYQNNVFHLVVDVWIIMHVHQLWVKNIVNMIQLVINVYGLVHIVNKKNVMKLINLI